MKSLAYEQSTEILDSNNNNSNRFPIRNGNIENKKTNEKYSLRQRKKRLTGPKATPTIFTEQQNVEIKEKSKPKAAPLSKYRRKTANARERTRMREINCAFENLRNCVPSSISQGQQTPTNEKLTKITTLRMAMKYIRTLKEALMNPDYDVDFLFNDGDSSNTYSEDIQCNNSNHMDLLPDVNILKTDPLDIQFFNKNRSTAKSKTKQRTKQKTENALFNQNTNISSECSTDRGIFLESDGESLHLSEPCLSPLGQNIKTLNRACNDQLELKMLFESDSDSLEFSEPCLSPLTTLDTFNPFGDLLHSEFTEHPTLDMYLT